MKKTINKLKNGNYFCELVVSSSEHYVKYIFNFLRYYNIVYFINYNTY